METSLPCRNIFQNEDEKKVFLYTKKKNLRECVTSRMVLQENTNKYSSSQRKILK